MTHPAPMKHRRTFKRELAAIMMVFLCGLAVHAGWGTDPAVIEARTALVGVLAFPIILFAMAAYGLDAASKQLGFGKPSFKPDIPRGEQDYVHFPE